MTDSRQAGFEVGGHGYLLPQMDARNLVVSVADYPMEAGFPTMRDGCGVQNHMITRLLSEKEPWQSGKAGHFRVNAHGGYPVKWIYGPSTANNKHQMNQTPRERRTSGLYPAHP